MRVAGRAVMLLVLSRAQIVFLFIIMNMSLHALLPTVSLSFEQCPLTFSVRDIRYADHDEYLITISASNDSSKELLIKKIDFRFELQKERGWDTIINDTPDCMRLLLPFTLAAGVRSDCVMRFKMPLTIPYIFKTYEGDISLMATYHLEYSERLSGKESRKSGDALYWVSPRTSQWIHREGM